MDDRVSLLSFYLLAFFAIVVVVVAARTIAKLATWMQSVQSVLVVVVAYSGVLRQKRCPQLISKNTHNTRVSNHTYFSHGKLLSVRVTALFSVTINSIHPSIEIAALSSICILHLLTSLFTQSSSTLDNSLNAQSIQRVILKLLFILWGPALFTMIGFLGRTGFHIDWRRSSYLFISILFLTLILLVV